MLILPVYIVNLQESIFEIEYECNYNPYADGKGFFE